MVQDPEGFERDFQATFASEATAAPAKAKKAKKGDDEDEDDEFTTVGKGGKTIQYTPESIFKNLQVVQEARGKKVSICPWYPHWLLKLRVEHRSCKANPHPRKAVGSGSNTIPADPCAASLDCFPIRLQLLRRDAYACRTLALRPEGGRPTHRHCRQGACVLYSGDHGGLR